MTTPIIDPSTLSEEQREAIRERYALMKEGIRECEAYELGLIMDEYKLLFGSEFFKKGE